jgi:hypothetical protein
VPKKSKPAKRPKIGGRAQAPLYKSKPPIGKSNLDFVHAHPISTAPFELREDGSIQLLSPHPDPLPHGEGIDCAFQRFWQWCAVLLPENFTEF